MIEPKNPIFINYLGEIPINPDDLPIPDNRPDSLPLPEKQYRRNFLVGKGSDRPIGFPFSEMALLYWRMRSFKFSIFGTLPPRDALADFAGSGGTTGGGAGAAGGLAAVELLGKAMPDSFLASGSTKIEMTSRIRNRIKDRNIEDASLKDLNNLNLAQKPDEARKIFGDPDGPYASKILHIRKNRDNKKTGDEYRAIDINEGSLPSAGPVHKFFKDGCGLIVDFSYIIRYRYLYYPRIIVLTPWGNSWLGFSSETETEYGLTTTAFNAPYLGMSNITSYVFFKNGGLIPIYYYQYLQIGQNGLRGIMGPIINGAITYERGESKTSCCTRFYYDNSDEYRLANSEECKNCEQLGVGLKP